MASMRNGALHAPRSNSHVQKEDVNYRTSDSFVREGFS